ncbi:MAG: aspartate aminotransferase family protein [Lentisphaerae bacterium]|jgi:acetylornithine aminotransferase/acetylornithine/N-succinyldiaminopimelate aminotransferase|nr:aspartate aminotransferase family protein [Lentisphaerota bacterium]
MSNKTTEILDLYKKVMMPTFAPSVVLATGKGVTVRDVDGLVLYDFTSGIGIHNVGYSHPKVVQAIQEQAAALTHSSNLFATEPQVKLAEKLVELSGLGGKVFFCNSGAEANEAAIKLARKWGNANGGRYEIVTFRRGFHGRTLATVTATAQAWCQEGYDPLPVGFAYADFNDLESVKAAISDKTVAIMLEAIQGEGGVTPATDEFMRGIRQLCDEKNLLMICDEVQSGMGRTGTWFAWQGYDVKPDLFTLAKAIAGGLPMGALVSNAKFADVFTPGSHASTFGGNPVAAAAALAVIDVIESEKLLKRATEIGTLFREALQAEVDKHDKLLEVRGKGLMLGVVVDGDPKEVVEALKAQGILALTAGGNVVRFLPPLVLREEDLEEAIDMMSDAFDCVFGE